MIAAIARQEFRALLRDGRLLALGLALGALFAAALAVASQERARAERERVAVEAAARHQWDHQGARNPHRAAHFGLYAFKPRTVLSVLDPGVDAQAGQALWLEPHKRNMASLVPAADAPPSLGLDAFTPAFVLSALVPLLIVAVGHATVTREREGGTLRMLHASGVRGWVLLCGKWLGLLAALAVALGPPLVLGACAVLGIGHAAAAWPVALALMGCYAVWTGATVLVSAHCASSRVAMWVGAAVWLAGVFVVPRLAASAVQHAVPLPTGAEFWSAIQRDIEHGLPGDGTAARRMQEFDARLLSDHGVDRLAQLPFGANAKRRLFRDAYAAKVHALHFGRLWDRQERQQRMLRWMGVATPHIAVRGLIGSFAGTDLAHRRHFEEVAEAYRQRFTTAMDEWDLAATRGVTSFESRYAGNAQWQAIPAWRYDPPAAGFAGRAAAADAGALAGWALVIAVALWRSCRRLDP